eukprot:743410-Rhodomonas_salina.1
MARCLPGLGRLCYLAAAVPSELALAAGSGSSLASMAAHFPRAAAPPIPYLTTGHRIRPYSIA